ncbi:MAG: DUF1801 domain-containing protein [Verrucomicrobiota bacterium]
MNPKVVAYLSESIRWRNELEALRKIVLTHDLTEDLKWGQPCYTLQGGNVVLLSGLKDCCVLSFPKGALLKDTAGILTRPGENTQAARVIRFTKVGEIVAMEARLNAYLAEAIAVERAGLKVDFHDNTQLDLAAELQRKLEDCPEFKTAFEALTPGRQRAYNLHFSAPVQSTTRVARIEKCTPRILDGKGLNDCTCGLSKKMPACDGSHKFLRQD